MAALAEVEAQASEPLGEVPVREAWAEAILLELSLKLSDESKLRRDSDHCACRVVQLVFALTHAATASMSARCMKELFRRVCVLRNTVQP